MMLTPPPPMPKPVRQPTPIPHDEGGIPLWRRVLEKAGYPLSCVVLDFETYFDSTYSLRKMSTIEYIADPRFEILGVAWAEKLNVMGNAGRELFPNDPDVGWEERDHTTFYLRDLRKRFGDDLAGCTVILQNARFDAGVLAYHYGIFPRFIIDTKGVAAQLNARKKTNLAVQAEEHGLPAKGDTGEFKGCSFKPRLAKSRSRKKNPPPIYVPPMSEAKAEALREYAEHDAWLEWQVFMRNVPHMSRVDVELPLMHHTIELFTKPKLRADKEWAAKIKVELQDAMDDACAKVGVTPKEIASDKGFVATMESALPDDEKIPMKVSKKGMIPAVAKDDPERKLLEQHKCEAVRDVMDARSTVAGIRLHLKRVDRIVAQAEANGGMLRVPLNYHGAHTGRWSGADKINLQNLPSRNKREAVNRMRGILVPPDDEHTLVIVDAASVEARGVAWIAGQEDMCDLFRQGEDLYCVYAGRMANRKVRKPRPDDPPPVAKWFGRMRNMGKVQVLGCGYNMGWERCKEFARDVYDILLNDKEALDLVNTYRQSVPQITQFWRDCEDAFRFAAKYGKECTLPRGLRFHREGHVTIITLPNGRRLRYENVKVGPLRDREKISMPDPMTGGRIHMYGGYFTENIVQGFCRCLLAECILNCEAAGWPVALHTHDEVVCVVKKDRAEVALSEICSIMSQVPTWAPGLPLAAEGQISERYTK